MEKAGSPMPEHKRPESSAHQSVFHSIDVCSKCKEHCVVILNTGNEDECN